MDDSFTPQRRNLHVCACKSSHRLSMERVKGSVSQSAGQKDRQNSGTHRVADAIRIGAVIQTKHVFANFSIITGLTHATADWKFDTAPVNNRRGHASGASAKKVVGRGCE